MREADLVYLKAIEHTPFTPLGWLYTSVYDDLTDRGLAVRTGGSYLISKAGREGLDRIRYERNEL